MRTFATLVLISTASASAAPLPLLDDFNDGDLAGWTALGGAWSNPGGYASQTAGLNYSTTPDQLLKWGGSIGADFTFQAEVQIPDGSSVGSDAAGIAFRVQDSLNHYVAQIFPGFGGGAFRVLVYNSGVQTIQSGFNLDMGFTPLTGQYYSIRVQGSGNSYDVSVWDGTDTSVAPAFEYNFSDSSVAAGGVGLWNMQGPGLFDNARLETTGTAVPDFGGSALLLGLGVVCLWRARPLLAFQ